jgi:predicted CXXCH cytochrome family protein
MQFLTIFVRGMSFRRIGECCAALFCVAAIFTASRWWPADRLPPLPANPPSGKEDSASSAPLIYGLPKTATSGGYVSSTACQSCHPRQHASWHKTFHRRMTQPAYVDVVLAPFNGEEVSLGDWTLRMTRRDDQFWVEQRPISPAADTPPVETRRIVMTTGSHHMQGYWVCRDQSTLLDQLPLMWLLEDDGHGRWVPRIDCFLTPPGNPTGAPFTPTPWNTTWNMNCVTCHSVNGVPGVVPRTRGAEVGHSDGRQITHTQIARMGDTTVAELGIACEACHGPGQAHIAAYQDVSGKRAGAENKAVDATIVNPKRLRPERSAQVCGQCHGVLVHADTHFFADWFLFGRDYRPGGDLSEKLYTVSPTYFPSEELKRVLNDLPTFFESSFWPDGMVRVAREYNGLVESACYQRGGMTCLDCHSMHDSDPNDMLGAGMDTNEACYRCHTSYREQIEAHSHHVANSSGSLCYNCHMPHTTYTLLKGIRSHQISSPDMATTVATGRPSACNLCHLDQTLAWSAENLSQWYGQEPVDLDADQRGISAAVLWMLRGDAVQRALLAWSCGWQPARDASGTDWQPPILARLLEDPYSAVRLIAGRSLKQLGYDLNYDYLAAAEARMAARHEAVERWRRRMADSNPDFPPGVLLGREGRIREDEIERLLSTRDDHPLNISE